MRCPMLFCASLFAALAIALSACGEDREGSVDESGGSTTTTRTGTTGTGTETATTTTPGGPALATVSVTETDFELDPRNPRIAKPGIVTFRVRNAGQVPHALEVEGPDGEVETGTIEPGRSDTLRADLSKPGSYVWYCPVGDHEARGMKGRITVAGRGGSGSPSAPTTDDPGGSGGY